MPLPCPVVADVSVIQLAAVDAVHVQSRVVVTVTVPALPLAGADDIELFAETWHLAVVGASTLIDEDPHAATRREKMSADVSRMPTCSSRASMRTARRCKAVAPARP